MKNHKAIKSAFNVGVSSFQSFVEIIHNQWYYVIEPDMRN